MPQPKPDWQRARCEMEEHRIEWAMRQIVLGAQRRKTSREIRAEARAYAAKSCRLAIAQQR